MEIKRECYIITYKFKKAYKNISKIEGLEIFYSSKKQRYITAYFDTVDKERILKALKDVNGIGSFEPSLLDQTSMNVAL